MKPLADILIDLGDTDLVLGDLRDRLEANRDDPIARVNLDALAKRRQDLERWLDAELRDGQLDLVSYRVAHDDGRPAAAAIVARSLCLFQEMATAVFDALRSEPKQRYAPSPENMELSAFLFARPPSSSRDMHLVIPNDRLLAIRSDLDVALDMILTLLRLRSTDDVRAIAEHAGVSAIVALHSWAEHGSDHALTVSVGVRQPETEVGEVALTSRQATALQRRIEATAEDRVEDVEIECQLIGLDETRGTFRLQASDSERIEGTLDDGFPRGKSWGTNVWMVASLVRSTRLSYARGSERVRWILRGLTRPG